MSVIGSSYMSEYDVDGASYSQYQITVHRKKIIRIYAEAAYTYILSRYYWMDRYWSDEEPLLL